MAKDMKFLKTQKWNYKKFTPPARLPEAVIQAEIYRQLHAKNIQCTLECPIFCDQYGGELTPDVAILHEGYVIGLIEVKSFKKVKTVSNQIINNLDSKRISSKQLKRYLLFNLPLYYCNTRDDIPRAVAFAELCIREFEKQKPGIPFSLNP